MQQEILINARGLESRIALLEDGALAEVEYENHSTDRLVGNIYKGTAKDVLSGLAAFIDVGLGDDEKLFLSSKEVNGALLKANNIRRGEQFPIQKAIRQGQQIIVQLKRGGIGDKNAQGTTKISLAGRYWIFMPKDSRLGISRRVSSPKERSRLKNLAREFKRPDEGLIARTAARGVSRDELERDFNYLLGTWKGVEDTAVKSEAPALLYEGPGFLEAYLRDRLMEDVDRITIDAKTVYDEMMEYLDYLNMSEYKSRLHFYRKREPLFDAYGVEEMIEQSLKRSVALPGGGNIVIEETEALTAIDINTGSNVRFKGQGDAIFNTNMAAALEIPKQLRLRKISGIIIVDFVDMVSRDHQQRILNALQRELRKDPVSADLVGMTQLGLVEITRKRKGESLADMLADEEEEEVERVHANPIRRDPPPMEVEKPEPKKRVAAKATSTAPKRKRKPAAKKKAVTSKAETTSIPEVATEAEAKPVVKKRKPATTRRRKTTATAKAEASSVETASESPTEKKPTFRRGRKPRQTAKSKAAQTEVKASDDAQEASTPKRKPTSRRRRPAKKKVEANAETTQTQPETKADEVQEQKPKPKRRTQTRRRRPTKKAVTDTAQTSQPQAEEAAEDKPKRKPATRRRRPQRKAQPKAADAKETQTDASASEDKPKRKPATRRRKPQRKAQPKATDAKETQTEASTSEEKPKRQQASRRKTPQRRRRRPVKKKTEDS